MRDWETVMAAVVDVRDAEKLGSHPEKNNEVSPRVLQVPLESLQLSSF